MAFNIFGLTIGKEEKDVPTIVYDKEQDGATEIVDYGGVYFDGYEDILKNIKDENDLINNYRCLVHVPEVDQAVIEIVNESIVYPKSEVYPVKLNLDEVELSEPLKQKINDTFEEVLKKLKFDRKADDLFRNWYIDGRCPVYIHVEKNKTSKGMEKLIYIDPLQIRKIREIRKGMDKDNVEKILGIQEYYIYNPNNNMPTEFGNMSIDKYTVGGATQHGIKLTNDSIVYATSELMDEERKFIISHLHKAIKPANQLSQIEDAMVIYRLSRAPERRVFYVDVGNLPKQKAEAYLASLMGKFRNKMSYNSTTGKIKNQTHQKAILEDFWLPRREGGKGTEITTLGGGEGFQGVTEETRYFKEKLYKALNVPIGRIDSENTFVFGKEGEITRDEVKFAKFISNLRNCFAHGLFDQLLRTELILTKVMNEEEYKAITDNIFFMWEDDSHFAEMKELDVTMKRLEVLELINEYKEMYYSKSWIRKHILFQNDEEIEELKKEREEEAKEDNFDVEPSANLASREFEDEEEPEPPAPKPKEEKPKKEEGN